MPNLNLGLDLIDLLIKQLQMLEQSLNEGSKHIRQIVGHILDQSGHTLSDLVGPGGLGLKNPLPCAV